MKKLLTIIFLLGALIGRAQVARDTFNNVAGQPILNILDHQVYTDTLSISYSRFHTAFSKSAKYVIKATWRLTAADIDCEHPLGRLNKFFQDSIYLQYTDLRRDYKNSGHDQGHNCDASDNKCLTPSENLKCWLYTNMTPQAKKLNEQTWRYLEDQCRKWVEAGDELVISCGSFGHLKEIGPDHVVVPSYCWKVVKHKNGRVDAYIFPNISRVTEHAFTEYAVPLTDVEVATGLLLR